MHERDTSPQRLDRFLEPFRDAFRRREQADWAAVYLQGLLRPNGRKTIENLARTIALPDDLRVEDVAQALQHFINQSPWDERKLWRRQQSWLAERLDRFGGVLVLEEFAFPKQGRHSVGVQRQYSAELGRKLNCQIAVSLHHVSAAACSPLTLRLYLPRHWLEDRSRLDAAAVPESTRRHASKTTIALELVDEVLAAGIAAHAVAPGNVWKSSDELRLTVEERGLTWLPEMPLELADAARRGRETLRNELGLDHFEGRSWRGFHHHTCLVMLAHAFRMHAQDESGVRTE
jgi:SRSO17 transposase